MGSDWISTEPVVWIPGESQSGTKNGGGEVRSRGKNLLEQGSLVLTPEGTPNKICISLMIMHQMRYSGLRVLIR